MTKLLKITLFTLLLQGVAMAGGYLGVQLKEKDGRLHLNEVTKDSPASAAGLRQNDIITHVAGAEIKSMVDLAGQLKDSKPGDKLIIDVLRNNVAKKHTLTLGAPPKVVKKQGIIDVPAPSITSIKQWHNLPEGKTSIDLADYKGKTVYLYCFQSWCPGCHSAGFPIMKQLIEHYKNDDSVVFLAAQTVFEGFKTNSFKNGQAVLKKFGLTIPMAQDGTKEKRSVIMEKFSTRGTPWTIVIDPDGTIRHSSFYIKKDEAIKLIDGFKKAKK